MQIIHLDLKLIGDNYAQFRYFAEKISQCFKKHETKLEKVEIVSGEKRLLLKEATVEQIKDILESF